MAKHLQKDLENLKKKLVNLYNLVEAATNKAILALMERRKDLAEEVLQEDHRIDINEIEIEEECLKMLALHQPVACDLRFIIGVLKVNNDIERMGDLAVNIAERSAYLSTQRPVCISLDFPKMAEDVKMMVRLGLDSLIKNDTELARQVLEMDDVVDEANRRMFATLQEHMREDPDIIDRAIHLLSVSRHLERIADLATNIAEDVVYMVDGELIRHRVEDYGNI